jgi:TRAP-type C4-dicarboxylate transport system permease small subunit
MKRFLNDILKINMMMQTIAAISLTFMILLTTVDVVVRIFGKPIPGAVEIIAICGGVVIGFTIPSSFWMKSHISVDFVLNRLPNAAKNLVNVVTRCIGIGLCLLISWNSVKIGTGFLKGAEVSGTLEIPLYPVAYALGACFLALSLVLLCDILKIFGGTCDE